MYADKERLKGRKWSHEAFIGGKQERKLRCNSLRGTWPTVAGFEGSRDPGNAGSLWKLRKTDLQPAGKQRPQSYNHRELDSANNLSEPGNRFLPRAFRNEEGLAHTLISTLWDSKQRTSWVTTVLGFLTHRTGKIINGCHFKLLNLYDNNRKVKQYLFTDWSVIEICRLKFFI